MSRRPPTRQRGAALLILMTILILGVAWFTVGALGKAAPTTAEKEMHTAAALQAGKQALLAYVAQYAARSDTAEPGQLPCPESLALSAPGQSSSSCSPTAIVVGRLPWKTLGIDPLFDGDGEPLWYVMRGFRDPPINFGSAGQLSLNGSAVVALIVAPGSPLNTASQTGTLPADCTKQNQMVASRNSATLSAANFIECGLGAGTVTAPGTSTWTNDRVIGITAAEWADAIAPAVADRLQRQVAPAMYDFYNATSLSSWGERFYPNASTFSAAAPASNSLCGDTGVREGMPPTATVASGLCDTSWTAGGASGLPALLSLSFGGCNPGASYIQCDFFSILGGLFSPRISVTAPRVGYSFRRVDTSQILLRVNGGAWNPVATGGYSNSVSASDGSATFSFQVGLPLLSLLSSVSIRVPNPDDALLVDARSAWYVTNGWDRYTFYGVSRAVTSDPGASVCTSGNLTDCLTVNGMTTPNNDKRLVLVLMGRALAGQAWGSTNGADYFEGSTAAGNATIGDRTYTASTVTSTFNDRLAACPFGYLDATSTYQAVCN